MSKFLVGMLLMGAVTCVGLGWYCKEITDQLRIYTAENAVLKEYIAELQTLVDTQRLAIEQIKAVTESQADKLAKAQAQATSIRVGSENRVREILTVPVPDDTHELVAWALLESQKLDLGGAS